MHSRSSVYFNLFSLTEQTERQTEDTYSGNEYLPSVCWPPTNIQIHTNIYKIQYQIYVTYSKKEYHFLRALCVSKQH